MCHHALPQSYVDVLNTHNALLHHIVIPLLRVAAWSGSIAAHSRHELLILDCPAPASQMASQYRMRVCHSNHDIVCPASCTIKGSMQLQQSLHVLQGTHLLHCGVHACQPLKNS